LNSSLAESAYAIPQLPQSPVEQLLQLLATDDTSPSALFVRAEKTDITRSAPSCPLGQVAASSERLIDRKSSNLFSQIGQ
jgi:hypothetical protein